MLTTALLTAQSIGTGVNIGEGVFSGFVDLQATTGAYSIQARWNAGAGNLPNRGSVPRVHFATSSFNTLNAAQGKAQLIKAAQYFDIDAPMNPSDSMATLGALTPAGGQRLHWWVDVPASLSGIADTLDLNLLELN